MLNIKHPYQLHPYERSGDCHEFNQLHFIIMQEINIHLHNCNLWTNVSKIKTSRVFVHAFLPKWWRIVNREHSAGRLSGPIHHTSRQLHCLTSDAWNCGQAAVIGTITSCGLYAGNLPVTSEFPAQKNSNAENVSNWWRHHAMSNCKYISWFQYAIIHPCPNCWVEDMICLNAIILQVNTPSIVTIKWKLCRNKSLPSKRMNSQYHPDDWLFVSMWLSINSPVFPLSVDSFI